MKLAILGTGMIAKEALPMLKKISGIEITALLSSKKSLPDAQSLAKSFDISSVYDDFDKLLRDASCDTVYITLPNHLHFEYAKQAIQHKKHVICEKPFTDTFDQLVVLEKLAIENNVFLFEAITTIHQNHYNLIKSNLSRLGEIRLVELNFSQYSSRYDAFKNGEILPVFDAKKSGGALKDLNIYNIHFVVGLFGLPHVISYYPTLQKNVDTSGVLILDYKMFKAVLIAAKDSSSSFFSKIQGEEGWMEITSPINDLRHFNLNSREKKSLSYQETSSKHRMSSEFENFQKIIEENDFKEFERLMGHSKSVMSVLDEANRFLE